jgi:hypothetical protein
MHRRDVLRLLATGTALQLAPGKLFALAREARALLADLKSPRTLNPHQYETVKTLAELIIPRTDTPGATDVGVADFIDLILTEWYEDTERTLFLNGIADVDVRANRLFGKDFVACAPVQQGQILIDLGERMMEQTGPARSFMMGDSAAHPNFYLMFRRLTLTGYYTSEAGATKELDFQIIPDGYDGCAAAPGDKEAAKP